VRSKDGAPIAVEQALRILVQAAEPFTETERVALADAWGRVLAEDVRADRDFPPTDRSAMDGYAVRSADATTAGSVLRVIGEVRAGQSADVAVTPGTAVRITTGAIVPAGADAVAMVERTTTTDDGGSVRLHDAVSLGENVRGRAGEASRGDGILAPGSPIHAAEIGVLASVGRARPQVFRRPAVCVLSTGDEVVSPDASGLADHQIRNSNVPALCAMLREMGVEARDLGNASDDRADLAERVGAGLTGDLLLLTGGVSVGTYDLVAATLAAAGAERLFHGVAMKPGKPVLAARRGACLAIGLPGNPVSACTVFAVLVAPALRRRMGLSRWDNAVVTAMLDEPLDVKPGRATYHLARLDPSHGRFRARTARSRGSGDVLSMARANAWLITPAEGGKFPAGAELPALPWRDYQLR